MRPPGELFLSFYGLVGLRISGPMALLNFLRTEWGQFEVPESDRDPHVWISWRSGRETPAHLRSDDSRTKLSGWYKGCLWRATSQKRKCSPPFRGSHVIPAH